MQDARDELTKATAELDQVLRSLEYLAGIIPSVDDAVARIASAQTHICVATAVLSPSKYSRDTW